MSLFPKFFPRLFTAAAVVTTLVMGASAAMAGPYSVRWGGVNEVEINPLYWSTSSGGFRPAAHYYSYSSPNVAAANTPDGLERSDTATMFLYDDPNTGLSLFHIYDRPHDGTGSRVSASITSTGLAGTGQSFLVRDDPGDNSFAWNDATGSANLNFVSSSCCTDGWVLGLLPDQSTDSWSIDVDFTTLEGINTFDIVTLRNPLGAGPRIIERFSIAANEINTLEFVRTGETVTAVAAPAGLIFPLAALGLIAIRRRMA